MNMQPYYPLYELQIGMLFPALYEDDIYDICFVIVKRMRGEENIFHYRTRKARIDIEHEFGLNKDPNVAERSLTDYFIAEW